MLLAELRARLLADPQVIDVDGVLCRIPSHDRDLGQIVFWEPLLTNALPAEDARTAALVEALAGKLAPLRVMTEGALANATYEYHAIDLVNWPAHRPLRTRANSQSIYNRLRRDAEAAALDPVTGRDVMRFEPMTPSHSRSAITTVMEYGSLTDRATLYSYLSGDQRDFDWLCLWRGTIPYAYFLVQQPTVDSAYSYYVWLHPEARASIATWHLISHLVGEGVRYFDCWNVAATEREQYKRAFFTAAAPARCYYSGWNPYPWLVKD